MAVPVSSKLRLVLQLSLVCYGDRFSLLLRNQSGMQLHFPLAFLNFGRMAIVMYLLLYLKPLFRFLFQPHTCTPGFPLFCQFPQVEILSAVLPSAASAAPSLLNSKPSPLNQQFWLLESWLPSCWTAHN